MIYVIFMPGTAKGSSELLRIFNILKDLSMEFDPPAARLRYTEFPSFAEHIAKLFAEDRLFDILPRLEIQLQIVSKYDIPVRPALDPYISTQIGIFSKAFSDLETGHLLNYPDCCIKSFSEEIRYGLDERHRKELGTTKDKVFVTTAGFVPHSVFCGEAHSRGLIGFVSQADVLALRELEKELAYALPHCHSEYQQHYFEIMDE
jgi:hypothetical protein